MKTILVTGGAGFIGSHCVDAFLKEGYRVVVVDNFVTGNKSNLNQKAVFYKADIRNAKRMKKIFEKEHPTYLCHHAAQMDVRKSVADPAFDAENNILGSVNLLELCVQYKIKKVLFASTGGAIYGDASVIPTPETYEPAPVSPYGIAKRSVELYLHYYHVQYGLAYTALRYANVYGPRQNPHGEAGVVAIFCKKLIAGEQPIINGDGKQTRDYVFVGDVVAANLTALQNAFVGFVNIGTGTETSVNALYAHLVEITNASFPQKHGPAKQGEQQQSCLDWHAAEKHLSWKPVMTLSSGLDKTVAWFRANI